MKLRDEGFMKLSLTDDTTTMSEKHGVCPEEEVTQTYHHGGHDHIYTEARGMSICLVKGEWRSMKL